MSMDGKVAAFSTRTGRATRVPPHYLEHPVLSQQYSAEPVVGIDDQAPAKSWNVDRIRAWATEHGVDLGDAETKAQMLAVIDGTTDDAGDPSGDETSDGTPPTDQPPA